MPPGTAIVEPLAVPSAVYIRGKFAHKGDRIMERTAWWLWPHLLSLDAPLVAVVWQCWWARATGSGVTWGRDAVLGGGVWLIYLADRLADTASSAPSRHETARHAFYQKHHSKMRFLALTIFLALSWLTPWMLNAREFLTGLGLFALASGYFWLVHLRADGGWARVLPKEALVGGMFVVGTLFFVLGRIVDLRPQMLLSGALFGGVCFFNCALITKWERKSSDLHDPGSLLNAFPRLTAHLRAGCVCLALLAGACAAVGPRNGNVFVPMAISAVLLAILDRQRSRLSTDALRVLADAALLTPCLCLHFTSHL